MVKKPKNIPGNNLPLLMVGFGLALGLYGFNLFWSGFHDFDMAQNMIFLRDDIQLELWENNIGFALGTYAETTTLGKKISLERLYFNGIIRMKLSIPLIMLGFFTIGYYLKAIGKTRCVN